MNIQQRQVNRIKAFAMLNAAMTLETFILRTSEEAKTELERLKNLIEDGDVQITVNTLADMMALLHYQRLSWIRGCTESKMLEATTHIDNVVAKITDGQTLERYDVAQAMAETHAIIGNYERLAAEMAEVARLTEELAQYPDRPDAIHYYSETRWQTILANIDTAHLSMIKANDLRREKMIVFAEKRKILTTYSSKYGV